MIEKGKVAVKPFFKHVFLQYNFQRKEDEEKNLDLIPISFSIITWDMLKRMD